MQAVDVANVVKDALGADEMDARRVGSITEPAGASEAAGDGEAGQSTSPRRASAARRAAQPESGKDGGSGASAKRPKGPSPPRRVNLTPEQQEWLNTVFIPNFRAELMRTLKPEQLMTDEERARLKESRRRAEELEAKQREMAAEHETQLAETEQAHAQRAAELDGEINRLRGALAETRVDRELVWAAASAHAINPAQVAHLLKERVRLDENLEPIVVTAHGEREVDPQGRFVSVADAARTFLEENPHLVRPSTAIAGGGSGGTDATTRARRVAAISGGDLIEEALREGE